MYCSELRLTPQARVHGVWAVSCSRLGETRRVVDNTAVTGMYLRGFELRDQATTCIVEIGAVGKISGHQDSSRDCRWFRIENAKCVSEFRK